MNINSKTPRDSFPLPDIDRGHLITETDNPNSKDIDLLSTYELVELFNQEDIHPQLAVSECIEEISNAIDQIVDRIKLGGRLFYLGAGTSGRLGVLDAVECPPTFCTPPELVQGVLAGGYPSLVQSSESMEDEEKHGKRDLELKSFNSKDSLVGISAGGTTPYVNGGLKYSKSINALSVAISCVPRDQVSIPCDIDIRLVTGPEIISGSTRLKAGTATKMALNIISSSVMIKLGKVYGNRMIDLAATNKKLVDRSLRILNDLANVERHTGLRLLHETKGCLKTAILMALTDLSIKDSKALLKKHNNQLRSALNS